MRYLPLSDDNRAAMRDAIGVADTSDLFRDVPAHVLLDHPVDLPFHQSEMAVERTLAKMASRNLGTSSVPSFLGAGAYRHPVPALVDHLIQRGEFLTSYTPYQPEVSQGTLQYLFEFQTQVALLTGMEVANASLYDGATAVAEAITMAARITRRRGALVSGGVHPHYRQVAETQARHLGIEFQMLPPVPGSAEDLIAALDDTTACVVVQNPGLFGEVCDYTALAAACHDKGALLVVAVPEVVSLGALMSPGEMGADIVVGEGQGLGGGLNFGGPYLGLMATRQKFIRQMPGRLAGETVDSEGRRGWVLTLSTREQHIRREKATSNICTNSGLISLAFTIHLSLLGEAGLGKLAALNHARACQTADRLAALPGVEVLNETFFNEFTVRLPKPAEQVVETLAQRGILAGVPLSRLYPEQPELASLLLVCATEANDEDDMDRLTDALQEALS